MTGVDECTDQTGPLRGPRAPPAPGPASTPCAPSIPCTPLRHRIPSGVSGPVVLPPLSGQHAASRPPPAPLSVSTCRYPASRSSLRSVPRPDRLPTWLQNLAPVSGGRVSLGHHI